jgi:hypothetical protein
MRVELIYAPGCNSYASTRNTLEMLIADEGLPIPVELVESAQHTNGSHAIRIDGEVHLPKSQQPEVLRTLLRRRWQELTHSQLMR